MIPREQPSPQATPLRVLLVEDDVMVALLLEDMLAELGHEVVGPVTRLGKAVEMAREKAFDAAILDVNIDGEESIPSPNCSRRVASPSSFVRDTAGAACASPIAIVRLCKSPSDSATCRRCSRRSAERDKPDALGQRWTAAPPAGALPTAVSGMAGRLQRMLRVPPR